MQQLRKLVKSLVDFVLYLGRRFIADEGTRHAATLAYTSLLSVVPLLTVGFSLLAAFPVFDAVRGQIRVFILSNLAPASGEAVQQYLEQFIEQATGLTALGTVGLVASALLMMSAIDKALNDIWRVHNRRRPIQGFLVYWTVLTLSPVLIGASLAVSSYLLSTWGGVLGLSAVNQALLGVMPFLTELAAFAFLYAAVPNRRVPVAHAVAGGLLAAILFEFAKAGFALYVRSVPAYQVIYGALAAVPLFLVWLYVSWLVVLLGAEFTQALTGFREERSGGLTGPRQALALAVRILGQLWRAQRQGRSLNRRELARHEPRAGEMAIHRVLIALERARVVVHGERGGWVLSRDLRSYSLWDLYRDGDFHLPVARDSVAADDWDRRMQATLEAANDGLRQTLDRPLAEVFEEQGQTESL